VLPHRVTWVEFVDATDLIVPIKAVKSEEELVFMRRAAEMHDKAVDVARRTVRPGLTANDVIEECAILCFSRGPTWLT